MNELEDNLNDYINGTINFLTYRQRRTQYINSFVDSGYLPDDTIPLNDAEQQQIKDAVRQKIKDTAPLDTSTYTIEQSIPTHNTTQYIGLVVLIIAAIFVWYYSTSTSEHTQKPSPVQSNQTEQTKTSNTQNQITHDKKFVINFLKMDNWNSETLSEFLVKWQALSRTQKKQTKQSQSFIRLKNSLRLRILEQQALQSTKNKAAERQENLLIWFASQISVSVS